MTLELEAFFRHIDAYLKHAKLLDTGDPEDDLSCVAIL
jgi:hypothetical protein